MDESFLHCNISSLIFYLIYVDPAWRTTDLFSIRRRPSIYAITAYFNFSDY